MSDTFTAGELTVHVLDDPEQVAARAADLAARTLRDTLDERGTANVMFASGKSQVAFLAALTTSPGIDWSRVVAFHMDEYVGLPAGHPARFDAYMRAHVAARAPVGAFHFIRGEAADPDAEARRYEALLRAHPLDLCCLGIGENGHLAFNDPPFADFDDARDVKVVTLADASRRQQVGEGHFASVADVPARALTVTIPALLRAGRVLVLVPEARKARPVRAALAGPITPACPASVLRRVPQAVCYLDRDSAGGLSRFGPGS